MSTAAAIFLDTSIQIARVLRGPKHARDIEGRLKQYGITLTGLIVRQEFKRRVLKEAKYLIEQLDRRATIADLLRHLNEGLGPYHDRRKRKICINIVASFLDRGTFKSESNEEQIDRLRAYLEFLLETGLDDFDDSVDHVVQVSGCAAALSSVRKRKGKYDLGNDFCSRNKDCGVAKMLAGRKESVDKLVDAVAALSDGELTDELKKGKQFLQDWGMNPAMVCGSDPCLKVGDILVAIESATAPTFYTMNHKESRYLAPALGQELVVHSSKEGEGDVVCPVGVPVPQFGKITIRAEA